LRSNHQLRPVISKHKALVISQTPSPSVPHCVGLGMAIWRLGLAKTRVGFRRRKSAKRLNNRNIYNITRVYMRPLLLKMWPLRRPSPFIMSSAGRKYELWLWASLYSRDKWLQICQKHGAFCILTGQDRPGQVKVFLRVSSHPISSNTMTASTRHQEWPT
jgi:hypothetical protein